MLSRMKHIFTDEIMTTENEHLLCSLAVAVYIQVSNTNQCMNVKGGKNKSAAKMMLYGCITGAPNEQFIFSNDGTIQVAANRGLCMNAWGDSVSDGAGIRLYQCNGGANEKFTYNHGTSQIQLAGTDKCMNVWGGDAFTDYSRIRLYTCNSGANEKFTLRSSV